MRTFDPCTVITSGTSVPDSALCACATASLTRATAPKRAGLGAYRVRATVIGSGRRKDLRTTAVAWVGVSPPTGMPAIETPTGIVTGAGGGLGVVVVVPVVAVDVVAVVPVPVEVDVEVMFDATTVAEKPPARPKPRTNSAAMRVRLTAAV